MGYNIPVLNCLIENYNSDIKIISWKKKITAYEIEESSNISFLYKEDYSIKELENIVLEYNADCIVVSGWMDKDYLKICKKVKKFTNTIIVGAMDTQWNNSFRHILATLISPLYHKLFFDYLWVSGSWQYEYARRLGFPNEKIIFNCYSADNALFGKNEMKINRSDKKLLFLGRFDKVKGIELLLNSFVKYKKETKSPLKLKLIGGGVELGFVKSYQSEDIEVKEFVQPKELLNELKDIQGFILPSVFEPWGLVIHEMANAGLPILSSKVCGANTMFVINNFNGFVFEENNESEIYRVLKQFDGLSNEELIEMGKMSKVLGKRITPKISAASLMSIFQEL